MASISTQSTVAESGKPAPPSGVSTAAWQWPALAMGLALALNLAVLLGFVVLAAALAGRPVAVHVTPRQPLLIVAVGFLLAQASLGAVWWARSHWFITFRTAIAVVSCAVLWLLLVSLLESARTSGVAAAAWGLSLTLQTAAVAIAATGLELWVDFRAVTARNRFSVAFLLLVMTAVCAVLGGGSAWAAKAGWKIADVPAWQFFWQLQAVGMMNAVLAMLTLGSLRIGGSAPVRLTLLLTILAAVAGVGPAALHALFDKAGASKLDLAWLFVSQGLFLAVSLWPSEWIRGMNREWLPALRPSSMARDRDHGRHWSAQ